MIPGKPHHPRSSRADLPGDGYVTVSEDAGGGLILARLHRSDDATDDAFYANSKAFMDLALKGLNVTRTVGEDNVRVTSLGAALSDTLITDRYGRKWQQRVWPLPYMDAYIVGMLLPTPDGYGALLQYVPSSLLQFGKTQSNQLVDYVDISYSGTIAQWQAHLKRHALLPAVLSEIKLDVSKDFTLQTSRFLLGVPSTVLPVDQRSELELGMGFMRNAERAIWEVGSAKLYRDSQRKSFVVMQRQKQPPPSAKLDLRNHFMTMQNRRSPYDSQVSRETTETYVVSSAIAAPAKTPGMISPDLLYGLTLGLENDPTKTSLIDKHTMLLRSVKVVEIGEASETAPAQQPTEVDNNKAAATAKVREQIEQMLKLVDAESGHYGTDSRARSLSQDIREFVTQPMERVLAQSIGTTPEGFQILTEARDRANALHAYWVLMPRLNSNRQVWVNFLESNHLSPITAHSIEVRTLEIKLDSLLAGPPSAEWATQAEALTDAYFDERKAIVTRQPLRLGESFLSRKTLCPGPSAHTSGTSNARLAPNAPPLPENYPAASERNNEEGVIMLSVQVDSTGCATAAKIVGSSGYKALDAAALELYESMQFLPAEQSGKAIASSPSLPIRYKIED